MLPYHFVFITIRQFHKRFRNEIYSFFYDFGVIFPSKKNTQTFTLECKATYVKVLASIGVPFFKSTKLYFSSKENIVQRSEESNIQCKRKKTLPSCWYAKIYFEILFFCFGLFGIMAAGRRWFCTINPYHLSFFEMIKNPSIDLMIRTVCKYCIDFPDFPERFQKN